MKNLHYAIIFLISSFIYSQNNFEIDIKSPSYANDSIMFGAPIVRKGFEDFYTFKIQPNKNVIDFAKKVNAGYSLYFIKIQEENLIKGEIEYPQPVSFVHLDIKNQSSSTSKPFFLEKGKYLIDLPKITNGMVLDINSPANTESQNLQKILSPLYVKSENPYKPDSLTSFEQKQKLLAQYIRKNPNSYVALWEIINDYTVHNYHPEYLENIKLFSPTFKANKLYKSLENRLKSESLTNSGHIIPTIHFDQHNKLTIDDFKKYKLTFIDYWATTCAPCIKSMPEIVNLYNDFKDKNVNFITITDEQKPERIQLAKNILKKNNATWINFFDLNKDFQKKVNATSYPLQFLIDENGKIIARIMGNIDEVRKKMNEYLK